MTPTPTPGFDADGRRIFERASGDVVLVVEGALPISGATPGTSVSPVPPDNRPDLQIQSNRDLGNGSTNVCDKGSVTEGGGGIPGIPTPNAAEGDPVITDALNDFACRFQVFTGTSACTKTDESGIEKRIAPDSVVQFCGFLPPPAAFHPGDSVVTVQLRDTQGNLGPTAQIVVRVYTPTPTPTATP